MRGGRQRPPVEILLDRFEAKGVSGLTADGRRFTVRHGPLGARISARRSRKDKADRLGIVEPAPDQVAPACPVFGLCGGCQHQEMPLSRQREGKTELVARLVGFPCAACEGAPEAWAIRNKLELSFGPRRFLAEVPDDPATLQGSWLGFHPPGWYSRVVSVDGCPLGSAAMNRAIASLSAMRLSPPWDSVAHSGAWRHVVLREGDQGLLVTLVTHSSCDEAELRRVGQALAALSEVSGVLWRVNDGLAEVAEGELRAVLHGTAGLSITLCNTRLELPADAFFQVNTRGAEVLVRRIAQALGPANGGTLLDLYCGVGAIGLCLHRGYDQVLGIELSAASIQTARENAARLGVPGQWHAGPVEEVLPAIALTGPRRIVVDPPRVGLHPKAAAYLATLEAEVLVYVACNPASLGRDKVLLEAGGWKMTDVWAVDLFPQTRHVEAVGRFVRG